MKDKKMNKYSKSIIYGGLDGIVTTFAVVSGAIGGNLSTLVIIILGFSNLFADGFSMASGDYISESGQDKKEAFNSAIATFLSFNFFGVIPLVSYLLVKDFNNSFLLTISVVGLTLVLLGYVKSLLMDLSKMKTIIQTVAIGMVASGLAYTIGLLLNQIAK